MKFLKTILVLAIVAAASASPAPHPLSEDRIALINQKQSTWKAGKNFEVSDWERVKRMSSGVLPRTTPLKKPFNINPHDESDDVPETFDAREAWPNCDSIKQIWDQSDCAAGWAFGAATAMTDRVCIHSNQTQQVYLSVDDLLGCCGDCGFGCEGGFYEVAWEFWEVLGISTGGLYNSSQGCKDYSLPPCEHYVDGGDRPKCSSLNVAAPECIEECYDTSIDYEESLHYGSDDIRFFGNAKQMQLEIYQNGPIEAVFSIYEDFPTYKSGVYQTTTDSVLGDHAVKILGWGVENGVDYWLAANSWNTDWGENGYFRIIRGVSECGIEDAAVASLPMEEINTK